MIETIVINGSDIIAIIAIIVVLYAVKKIEELNNE